MTKLFWERVIGPPVPALVLEVSEWSHLLFCVTLK